MMAWCEMIYSRVPKFDHVKRQTLIEQHFSGDMRSNTIEYMKSVMSLEGINVVDGIHLVRETNGSYSGACVDIAYIGLGGNIVRLVFYMTFTDTNNDGHRIDVVENVTEDEMKREGPTPRIKRAVKEASKNLKRMRDEHEEVLARKRAERERGEVRPLSEDLRLLGQLRVFSDSALNSIDDNVKADDFPEVEDEKEVENPLEKKPRKIEV